MAGTTRSDRGSDQSTGHSAQAFIEGHERAIAFHQEMIAKHRSTAEDADSTQTVREAHGEQPRRVLRGSRL